MCKPTIFLSPVTKKFLATPLHVMQLILAHNTNLILQTSVTIYIHLCQIWHTALYAPHKTA